MRPNVLVVDDNRLYLETFCNLLQACFPHVRITTAEDGSSALGLTHQEGFDLIILDYQLKSLTGGDVVRHLRKWAGSTGILLPPIVVMSTQPDIAIFSRTMGATAFLSKPVAADELKAVVGPLLEHMWQPDDKKGPILWRIQPRPA